MSGGQDNGGEREGAGANKRDASGGTAAMRAENIELEKRELQVVRVVGEDGEIVNGVGEGGGEDGREVNLQERLGAGAEADEVGSHGLKGVWEGGDVEARGRGAARDHQLGEKSVDIFGRLQALKARDLAVQGAHFLQQRLFHG